MPRLDHIALRVAQGRRNESEAFFIDALGYRRQDEFEIYFNDEKTDVAMCVALEPGEKTLYPVSAIPWWWFHSPAGAEYHLAPEIFLTSSLPGGIVDNWVQSRAGVGGVHHLAYQVDDVEKTMAEWTRKGWASFTTATPVKCDGMEQVFSQPNATGVIFELIKRVDRGFCKASVRQLILSSKGD